MFILKLFNSMEKNVTEEELQSIFLQQEGTNVCSAIRYVIDLILIN